LSRVQEGNLQTESLNHIGIKGGVED